MYNLCILVSLALFIGLVHSFDWDIVVGKSRELEFYYNGALTHTEEIRSANQIHTISYDPVNYRVLMVDYTYPNVSISSFDLTTRKIQPLLMRDANGYYNARVVFEPVTQLFFRKNDPYIYSSKLSPASSDIVDETLLVKLDHVCLDIAVDSCGGYIYWITHHTIERARLNGSGREVLIEDKVYDRRSLTVDQQTQKIYWTEKVHESTNSMIFIKSANLDGKNITILYTVGNDIYATSLAVTKDFIYWQQFTDMGIFQLPKSPSQKKPRKLISTYISTCVYCRRVATNYRIEEQIQGIQNCEGAQAAKTSTITNHRTFCKNLSLVL
ncbi:hypothetical protein PYW07_010726 [Mythimna separata]|uniref:Prolow-density lipoprotein receptor-related protein 1-like beta-propeller domain-containing protein n=1 Tax=Mythimna separata TaxID=271217 RepID=A0AAD8DL71_MYTSE|nr:hypothetical protein PYW07_010726 [Mythimna separata]